MNRYCRDFYFPDSISEWFGPAPRRWARTLSHKVIWLKVM
jgi:hypothetical protein